MSIDAYQIAVSMSLTNQVSSELAKMSNDLDKTSGYADTLRKHIDKIKDASLSGGGKSTFVSGLSKQLVESNAHADKLIVKAGKLNNFKEFGNFKSARRVGSSKEREEGKSHAEEPKEKAESGKETFESGFGMLEHVKEPIEQILELERVKASMAQSGFGDAQIAEAMKYADATDIYGVSVVERSKIFADALIALKDSNKSSEEALAGAKVMMTVMANYKVAASTLQGKNKEAQEETLGQLSEIVEARGGLENAGRAGEIADAVFKAVQSSHHALSEKDYLAFLKQSGGAADKMSDRTVFGALQPMMGLMGGADLAKGMQAADQIFAGKTGVPSNETAGEATRLGLWDKNQIQHDAKGNVKSVQDSDKLANPELLKLMRTEPLEFAKKLQEIYQAHGITSVDKRERENKTLFGEDGAKVYNAIMRNLEPMEKAQHNFDLQRGPAAMNDPKNRSPIQTFMEAQAKYNDLLLRLGTVVLPIVVSALEALTPMLKELGDWMAAHPGTVKVLFEAYVGLAAAMAIGGIIGKVMAGFEGLSIALGGLEAIAAADGVATLGPILGAIALGIGALGVATAGMAWILENVVDPKTDPRNHPGMRRQHNRGKEDTWVRDMTLDQAHYGKHWVGGGHGGGWVDYSEEEKKKFTAPPAPAVDPHAGYHYYGRGPTGRWLKDGEAPPPEDQHTRTSEIHNHVTVIVDGKEIRSTLISNTSGGTTGINPSALRVTPAMSSAGHQQ
jgi:hypothetical protein